jgi:hypothetical protein
MTGAGAVVAFGRCQRAPSLLVPTSTRYKLDRKEVRSAIKNRLEELSTQFNGKAVEPIDCFDIGERSTATSWLNQRHTGENSGRGIVNWGGVDTARSRGRNPAL